MAARKYRPPALKKQSIKRARTAEEHRLRNNARRSMLRTSIRRVRQALTAQDKPAAETAFRMAVPIIDRMSRQGYIHPNTGARYKSRINAAIKALAA